MLQPLADILADIWLVPGCRFSSAMWAWVLTSTAWHRVPHVRVHLTELSRSIRNKQLLTNYTAAKSDVDLIFRSHAAYSTHFLIRCQAVNYDQQDS